MDSICKFGEHCCTSGDNSIWLQFVLTVLGAFLGFGTALYIYYKSIRREKKEQYLKQQSENKNRLKYHRLLIENLIKSTNNQINVITEYKVEQEKDLLNVIPPRKIATNDFTRLIYINKEIFDAINDFHPSDDSWIENFKKIHNLIDYIEGTFIEINRITSNHLEGSYRIALAIKEKIQLIPDRLSSIAFYLQKELGEARWQNDLYKFVNDEINKYGKLMEEKADLNRINNEYLDPLIQNILQNYKDNPYFIEIMFLAKDSRVKMNDIKTEVSNNINVLEEIKNELASVIKDIEKLNNVL